MNPMLAMLEPLVRKKLTEYKVTVQPCEGEAATDKAFDALESLCWEPGAENLLLTAVIEGKPVFAFLTGAPGLKEKLGGLV
jgi:hypothetical protein